MQGGAISSASFTALELRFHFFDDQLEDYKDFLNETKHFSSNFEGHAPRPP